LARVSKFRRSGNKALGFATVHEQPFPVPHYSGIDGILIEFQFF